jgi:hypothetical protein
MTRHMTGNRLSIYSPGGGADSASKSATAIFFADFAKTAERYYSEFCCH